MIKTILILLQLSYFQFIPKSTIFSKETSRLHFVFNWNLYLSHHNTFLVLLLFENFFRYFIYLFDS